METRESSAPGWVPFRERIKWAMREISDVLMTGDVKFACVVLGFAMIVWGVIGLLRPVDLQWFASGFAFEVAPWVWGLNHMMAGYMFVHCAIHNFPPGRSLLFGAYCCCLWSIIMVGRPSSSFSSGVTLNAVIVLMGAILCQRSGRR